VFYDLAESFTPLFTEIVIPAFERATGIKVEYRQVNGDQTVQQLIAAQRAGQPLHVDLMWYPNGQVRLGTETGIIANIPLSSVLPNARDLDPSAARVSRGYEHGGTVLPWHRNLTAIGYDTRTVRPERAPRSFPDLLAFARANPGKVAITNPARGGSGQGFLESAIMAMTTAECQARLFDFSFGPQDAEAWAQGPCLAPVVAYFRELKPHVEFTNGNTDTLNLIANGVAQVATVWEDQVFDFIGRGLLPPTVRLGLLSSGQVGDGDGMVIPAGTRNPAGALLFANFLMSDDVQVRKLGLVGSRTARVGVNVSALAADVAERLVPQDQVVTLSRKRVVATASAEATKRFVADVLQR
jgi:ABC-type uncharacterized transport system YnjBCD substrate-binding protein